FVLPLAKAFSRLQQATLWVAQESLRNREEAGAAATDYLRMFALVALAFMWARTVKVVMGKSRDEKNTLYQAKLATANFYMKRLLPQTSSLFAAIKSGAGPLMDVPEEWF
ncbi:MAG: acyl-CoA dehydrogenase C-terminal domain-containing protein, partial [Candidatus Binatia bacterium]